MSKVSFAQALTNASVNACNFPLSQLLSTCYIGDTVFVSILEDEYLAGLEGCKTCLHGRLLLPKGSQPLRYPDLKAKVTKILDPLKGWRLILLGKGYLELSFTTMDDMRKVLAMGSWNLNPGTMRLIEHF